MSQRHDMSPSEIQQRFPNGVPSSVVVTQRSDTVSAPTVISTPAGLPDMILVPLTITRRLVIRAIKTYLSSLLGVLGYGVASTLVPLPLGEFTTNLATAASLAVAPTVMNVLINLLILFTKLDESHPEVMG